MAKAVATEVLPEVKRLNPSYTADAAFNDGWVDDIHIVLRSLVARFLGASFEQQINRVARSTISMTEAESTDEFLKSVNAAVGVDMSAIIDRGNLGDYIEASIYDNVNLIKSVQQQYLDRVENIVVGGMRNGLGTAAIAKQLQQQTGITQRRAKFIARDQLAKVNNDVAKKRMQQSGIEHFRWLTSKDERVTGKPKAQGGKYPHAKIKCHMIAKRDIGFGVGVYTLKSGAEWGGETKLLPGHAHVGCRCVQIPVFSWEIKKPR